MSMKKVGIITITRGQNYGNKLQNYAVQQVLRKLGCAPLTILNKTRRGEATKLSIGQRLKKLSPVYIYRVARTRINTTLYIKDSEQSILKSFLWKEKNKNKIIYTLNNRIGNFDKFTKKHIVESTFTISASSYSNEELNSFDYFVCGSDQIWNPFYPQNSLIDFLQFASAEKRIAYAPSFGVSHIPENKSELYKKWISDIPHLSVREEKGATLIKELTGRDAEVLVDPTLMLTANEWLAIAEKPDFEVPDKFILTYFLGNQNRKYKRFIQKQAENLNCKIINLNEIREFEHYCVDPSGFVYLINKATLVCTDSFHGTVLSIILKRNFVVFDRVEDGHSMGSRMETLLKKFGMEERKFDYLCNVSLLKDIDFSKVKDVCKLERNRTLNFLTKAITGETQYT
jgi:hypothetical protein